MAFFKRHQSLVASAAIVTSADARAVKRVAAAYRPWQPRAFNFYDQLAEIHYPANYFGAAFSRFITTVGIQPIDSNRPRPPLEAERTPLFKAAEEALYALGDLREIQRLYGINRTVAADGWLYGEDNMANTDTSWEYLSILELRADSMGNMMRYPTGMTGEAEKLPHSPNGTPQYTAIRFWQAHPGASGLADGALLALGDDCERLITLNDSIMSRLMSRLSQAGILFLPNSLTVAGEDAKPDGSNQPKDPFFTSILKAMTDAIMNRGTAGGSIPIMLRGPSGEGDKIVHITMDREIDRVELELRTELRNTIATGLELPNETQQGMSKAPTHWCKPIADRVFAQGRGPVSVADLAIGDMVLTLGHDTGLATWASVESIYTADVTDEPMVAITMSGPRGPAWTTTQTPRHRNPVIRAGERIMVEASEVRVGDVLTTGAPVADLPLVQTYSDDLVRLLAWYSADGTLGGTKSGPGQIRIGKSWQRNPDKVAKLIAAATGVFGPPKAKMPHGIGPSWRRGHEARGMEMVWLNAAARDVVLDLVPGKEKIISLDFVEKLTASQLDMFLDSWLESDGERRRITDPTAGRILQRNPRRLDAIEYAATLSGRPTRRYEVNTNSGFTGEGIMHGLTVGCQPHVTVRSVAQTTYSGTIWCPTTRTGTWLAVDEGGWTNYTGNSTWDIRDSTVNNHLIPAFDDWTAALRRTYLVQAVKTLMGRDFSLDEQKEWRTIVLIGDPANVIQRSNTNQDTKDAQASGLVSAAYTRKQMGVDESAAPDEDELVRNLGRSFNDPYLSLWGLDVADEIDWSKVSTRQAGAPAAGGGQDTSPSKTPADNGRPVGGPGTGTAGEPPQSPDTQHSAQRMAAAADFAVQAAHAVVGARLRSLAARPEFAEIARAMKSHPNAAVVEFSLREGLLPDLGLSDASVLNFYTEALSDLQAAVAEWTDPLVARHFVTRLAAAAVDLHFAASTIDVAFDVLSAHTS